MTAEAKVNMPQFFEQLIHLGCLDSADIFHTDDGFWGTTVSISGILSRKGISKFVNDQGQEKETGLFFDDWYLYAIAKDRDYEYSLFKMREQEFDACRGGDGDTPGITISFIPFRTDFLDACLTDPNGDHTNALNKAIDKVVSKKGQCHSAWIKKYFIRPEADAAYLIADQYVSYIASTAIEGAIATPIRYREKFSAYQQGKREKGFSRIYKFIEQNNLESGNVVCDHQNIYLSDSKNLPLCEKNVIMATHTANVNYYSFAAEVRFHALFLMPLAKIKLPVLRRSVYDSAIRADMSIDDTEFQGPTPYYNLNSRMVRQQFRLHEKQ